MPLAAKEMHQLAHIAREAGKRILPYFQRPQDHGTRSKKDHSPVTDADMAAHHYLLEALKQNFPAIPVISEEDTAQIKLDLEQPFFLVDPLDGTRSFVRGEDEFTVNIGLVEGLKPVSGVIGVPARDLMYFGGVGVAPQRQEGKNDPVAIRAREAPAEGVIVTRSRSAPSAKSKAYLETLHVQKLIPSSSAIKFCWLAEGIADVYPRFGRTMEWDTAAGHAILNAAGGRIETLEGAPLGYGKPGFENPGFIAFGRL